MSKVNEGTLVILKSTAGALLGFSPRETVYFVGDTKDGRRYPMQVRSLKTGIHGFTSEDNLEEYAPKLAPKKTYEVGDVVHGKREDGAYRKDRHFKLTGEMNENAFFYEGVNFTAPKGDWIYDYQIGGKVEEAKPAEPTFKVGDFVTGKEGNGYRITNEDMTKGEVKEVYRGGERLTITVLEAKPGTLAAHEIGEEFAVSADKFEPYVEQEDDDFDWLFADDDETPVLEAVAAPSSKRFIRMIGSDIGYKDGDILELTESGKYFVDNDGDPRPCSMHNFEEVTGGVEVVEKPVTREAVIEYISEISTDDLIDIMIAARK